MSERHLLFFNLIFHLNSDSSTVQKYIYKEYRIEGPENGKPKKNKKQEPKKQQHQFTDYAHCLKANHNNDFRVKLAFSQIANLTRKSAIVVQDFRLSGK